jgi:hypothetical protein
MGKAGKVGIYSTTNYFLFEPVWFDLFGFILLKPKPNRTDLFFNFSNRFFSRFGFFNYCFSGFLGLIDFLVFLLTPTTRVSEWPVSTSCLSLDLGLL